jgi:hypothetical protein
MVKKVDGRIEAGLSLVSVGSLDLKEFEELSRNTDFSSYALAPSHLLATSVDRAKGSDVQRAVELRRIGGNINSLQGLFFGLGEPSVAELNDRAKWLFKMCEILECPNLVVGSPQYRLHPTLWAHALESLNVCRPESIQVSIENLCSGVCVSDSLHPWALSSLGSFFPAVDISNSLECETLRPEDIAGIGETRVVHLSGANHSGEVTEAISHLSQLTLNSESNPIPVIEIVAGSLRELFEIAGEFRLDLEDSLRSL